MTRLIVYQTYLLGLTFIHNVSQFQALSIDNDSNNH